MSEQPTETQQQQAGTPDGGTLPQLTNGERLIRAILDHRVVEFGYQGYRRTVEPYLLGLHEAGEPLLLGRQTAGASQSGEIPGWRTFITTAIDDVELTDQSFSGPPSGFNPYGQSMLEIFARAEKRLLVPGSSTQTVARVRSIVPLAASAAWAAASRAMGTRNGEQET
jgi:hypothetical protein